MTYKDCKVREKKGKYLVELYYTPTLCQAYGGIGAYIVIDKPNISAKTFPYVEYQYNRNNLYWKVSEKA